MAISSEKELAAAIERGDDYIEIEGDLKSRVIKIKAIGKVAWAIAIGTIGVAVVAIVAAPATGGISSAAVAAAAPVAVGVLGLGATTTAVATAVAAGGVGVLNKLRGYDVEKVGDKVILRKK